MAPGTERMGSAEANRRFYENQASIYDETEFCASDDAPRKKLRAMLNRALAMVGDSPRILDAGAGTGNVSLMLRDMGLETTLVDASPEMLARWELKAHDRGEDPSAELADLETFFESDNREWSLIVFSSVLHHLDDPASVLLSASRRLAPGGVIVTIFDPLAVDRVGQFLRRLDYGCWIAIHSPATLARAIARRVRGRIRRRLPNEPNIGELAERHAMSGLDDEAIKLRMEQVGNTVAIHDRFADARYAWIVSLTERFDQVTHFSFAFQRPASDP